MSKFLPFAQRTNWSFKTNKLNDDLNRLRSRKKPILDLTESNPTRCRFAYFENEIIKSLCKDVNLSYIPESRGNYEAREAICRYYKEKGISVSPTQIFLTSSTSEAYSYLFRLLINPGEQVLFPRPSYPLFSYLGEINDVQICTYPLCYKDRWNVDLNALSNILCHDTKALILVNPNNPTGSYIRSDELKIINTLCAENHVALICDEVFSDFDYDQNANPLSLIGNNEVLTFVLGGISKTLGLPQMKLSWIVLNGPVELVQSASARLEVIADTYLSVNTPAQNALSTWMSHREHIQNEIKNRIRNNYNFLKKNSELVKGCNLYVLEGGWYAILKLSDIYSEEEWAINFLNKDHVHVHPGYFYDFNEETCVVISLLPQPEIFQEGVKRILKRIKSNMIEKNFQIQIH